MKIFVDTAELDEISEAYSWGVVDGVTTNPSLIKKAVQAREEIQIEEYIEEICRTVDGPVSLEVISMNFEDMVREATILYERFNPVNDNVVVKVPVNPSSELTDAGSYEGLRALKELSERDIPTNTTLIMKPEQAFLAAKAGADYVSPFAGRIDDYIRRKIGLKRGKDYQKGDFHDAGWLDQGNFFRLKDVYDDLYGEDIDEIYSDQRVGEAREQITDQGIRSGVELVQSIRRIFDNYGFETGVLAASIRNSRQVREIAEVGADIATIPFSVLTEMLNHDKTEEGVVSFAEDVVPEYEALFE